MRHVYSKHYPTKKQYIIYITALFPGVFLFNILIFKPLGIFPTAFRAFPPAQNKFEGIVTVYDGVLEVKKGEKPFMCTFCNYSSTQRSAVKTHIRIKHSDE
uniref:C2H2-type domain-containing protein n=1 Tax=Cacopsylla melanoneura TaxID=428564 RepID=A0A8D8Z1C9_9HEMI